jgi:hypothetical protein
LKRLLSIWVLSLGVVLYAPAPEKAAFGVPDVVRVRLFSTSQPSEIRVTTAEGQRFLIDAHQTTSLFRSKGPVTLQTAGGKPIPLQYPLEVTADHGVLVTSMRYRSKNMSRRCLPGKHRISGPTSH